LLLPRSIFWNRALVYVLGLYYIFLIKSEVNIIFSDCGKEEWRLTEGNGYGLVIELHGWPCGKVGFPSTTLLPSSRPHFFLFKIKVFKHTLVIDLNKGSKA
jgi:hypothetical protein